RHRRDGHRRGSVRNRGRALRLRPTPVPAALLSIHPARRRSLGRCPVRVSRSWLPPGETTHPPSCPFLRCSGRYHYHYQDCATEMQNPGTFVPTFQDEPTTDPFRGTARSQRFCTQCTLARRVNVRVRCYWPARSTFCGEDKAQAI